MHISGVRMKNGRRYSVQLAAACLAVAVSTLVAAADETNKPAATVKAKAQPASAVPATLEGIRAALGKTGTDPLLLKALADVGGNASAPAHERFAALMLYASRTTQQESWGAASKALTVAESPAEKAEARLFMARYAPSAGPRKEQAVAVLEPLLPNLDALPRDLQRAALLALAQSYASIDQTQDAIKAYETLLGKGLSEGQDAYKLVWEVASLHARNGQGDKSMDAARKALAGYPEVELGAKVADVGAFGLKWADSGRIEEGIKLLRLGPQVLTNALPDAVVRMEIPLHLALAMSALAAKPPDPDAAEKEYRTAFEAAKAPGFPNAEDAYEGLSRLYATKRQNDPLCELALAYLDARGTNALAVEAVKTTVLAFPAQARDLIGRVIDKLRANIASSGASGPAAEASQAAVVQLLSKLGRHTEALQEARVLLYTCDDKSIAGVAGQITGEFKALDFNLGRANRFLRYQRFGASGVDGKPGTDDDLQDVLRAVKPLGDEKRSAVYAAALEGQGDDRAAYRRRARLYLYMEEPAKAFEALKTAFVLCPPTETELQSAVDDLTGLVVRLTRSTTLADSVVKYVMYGADGPDGRPGTADDLRDPTAEILGALAVSAEASAGQSSPSGAGTAQPAGSQP